MSGGAEAAKNLFDSAFSKTKEVLSSAAESAKGLGSAAMENVQKIIPGQQNNAAATTDPAAVPNTTGTAPPTAPQ